MPLAGEIATIRTKGMISLANVLYTIPKATVEATKEAACFDVFRRQLGCRLQLLRTNHDLTQQDVANYIGISRVAVGYLEQGRRIPSLTTLHRIASLYGMTIAELCAISDS